MDHELGFLAKLVEERADHLRRVLADKRGRGSTFAEIFVGVCDELSKTASDAVESEPEDARALDVAVRSLLRAKQHLDLLYVVVTRYQDDVGRRDLPVGLLYLIDEVVRDLLPQHADPLIHLDDRYMYSTLPLLETLPALLKPASVKHPHPVAFNLPGLDTGNAMFAPILAHEVGHTAWRQSTAAALDARIDHNAVKQVLQAAVTAGVDGNELASSYANWAQELMCDALAATLAGPSFLFASAVFLPAMGIGGLGSHPYPRDRVALTLRILEKYDWTDAMSRLAPATLDWCRDLASRPELSGHPAEVALREAMTLVEPAMIEVAEAHCANRLTAAAFTTAEAELFEHLAVEVPPALLSGEPSSPWLVICGSWFHEIKAAADDPSALPLIATDARVNRFAMKTVELAAVASVWRDHEPPPA